MTSISVFKRTILAISAGFIGVLLTSAITSWIFFLLMSFYFNIFSSEVTEQPLIYTILDKFFSYAPFVVGGIIVGLITRKRGWLYGALMGLLFPIVAFLFLFLVGFVPGHFFQVPLLIGLAACGGWIAERLPPIHIPSNRIKSKKLFLITGIVAVITVATFLGYIFIKEPLIESITPSEGQIGTEVTIRGSGFASNNDVVFMNNSFPGLENPSYLNTISSTDGKTIHFILPHLTGACPKSQSLMTFCLTIGIPLPKGTIRISVKNIYGNSNTVLFTIQ